MGVREHPSPFWSAKESGARFSLLPRPEKILWPEEGYTKRDLIAYYDRIFPLLAPFVRGRLLAMERCPDGMEGDCFFQRERPPGMPAETPTHRILHESGAADYVVGGKRETQLALVNLGCIAVHIWSSRARAPRKADWVCFDLDPASGLFSDASRAAWLVKEALDVLHLASFPKTSGGKGLHVLVPMRVGPDADETLRFAQRLGTRLAAAFPHRLTTETRVRAREGRVFLDPLRNAFGQTVVAPYSVRRRARAPVSTPLSWSEVVPSLKPDEFHIANLEARARRGDPWKGFFESRCALGPAMKAVARL